MYLSVQSVKTCNMRHRFVRPLHGFRLRFLQRGQPVPDDGVLRAAVFGLADFTDVTAGVTLYGLYVPAVGVMAQATLSVGFAAIHLVLPALMRAVQLITFLCVFVGRVAAGRSLHVLVVITADRRVRVAVRRVFMAAGVARLGLPVPTFIGVYRVVFA